MWWPLRANTPDANAVPTDLTMTPSISNRTAWVMGLTVAMLLLIGGVVLFAIGDDSREEIDAVFERSLVAVTEVLGDPTTDASHAWHESDEVGSCVWQRRALWSTDGQTASQAAVERIEKIVREERDMRVFPNEDEVEGPRTLIIGFGSQYTIWMNAGVFPFEAPNTFELHVWHGAGAC